MNSKDKLKTLRDSTVYDYRRNKVETIGDRPIQAGDSLRDKWLFGGALIGIIALVVIFIG